MGEPPEVTLSIGEAAKELGVSVDTIRRWANEGKLYNYARVSSHDQKADLTRQVHVLESYSAANGWPFCNHSGSRKRFKLS